MNLDELIDERMLVDFFDSGESKDYNRGRNDGRLKELNLIKSSLVNIEYNHKVKVPQFLADWYEEHKHDILSAKYSNLDTDQDERVREWYGKCEGRHPNSKANAQEVIAKMDLNGYEVEEEPKYYWRKKEKHNTHLDKRIYLVTGVDLQGSLGKGTQEKFTESEARRLLKNDFDMFEKQSVC